MSLPSRHFFIFLCWCLLSAKSSAWAKSSYRAKEYLGRLDTCRCVPHEVHCDEEVVALSYLSSYTHSVKVCIEGTRLCCPTAPPSMESPSKSPKEDSYFLVFKVAPNDHQGNPSRYNVKFIKGISRHLLLDPKARSSEDNKANVTEFQEQNGTVRALDSLEGSSSNVTTVEVTQSTSTSPMTVPGNTSELWSKKNNTGEDGGTVSYTKATAFMDSFNVTEDLVTLSSSLTHNSTVDANETTTIRNIWNASNVTSMPSSDFDECFLDACHGNLTTTNESLSTSLVKEGRTLISDDTWRVPVLGREAPYSADDIETEPLTIQDQATASSPLSQVSPSPGPPTTPSTPVNVPVTPNPKPLPASTTTPTPGFWRWLFG